MKTNLIIITSHTTLESGGVGTHLSVMKTAAENDEMFNLDFILGFSNKNKFKHALITMFFKVFKISALDLIARPLFLLTQLINSPLSLNSNTIKIICHDRYSALASILFKKCYRQKSISVVQVLHAPFSEQFLITHTDKLFYHLSIMIDKYVAKNLDFTVAVDKLQLELENNLLDNDLVDNNKSIIHNAIDNDKLDKVCHDEKLEKSKYIIIARHLQKKNGVEFGIQGALKFMNNSNKINKVIVVGDGPERLNLESEFQTEIQKGKVHFYGKLENIKTLALIKNATFSLVPSVPVGNYIEATSLTMLESMYLETPVIASDIGGLAETITDGENGFLVEPGNPDSIYKRLITLSEGDIEKIKNNAKTLITVNYCKQVWWNKFKIILEND